MLSNEVVAVEFLIIHHASMGAGCPYVRHTFYECGSKLFLYFRLFKNSFSYFDYVILAMRFKSAK